MATAAAAEARQSLEQSERRFFFIMGLIMSAIIVAGFMFNLAAGRSSFGLPIHFHIHGLVFVGWLVLFNTQNFLMFSGNAALHKRLGILAYLWLPLMVAAGGMIMAISARDHGGPFFFSLNEFLISNFSLLLCFAGLTLWALRKRRHTGWHRRLMMIGLAVITGPGVGRLLPMPLLMPNAWLISFLATLIFPVILMAADKRRHGRVHPAYLWGTGIYVGVFFASLALANSPMGVSFAERLVAGTPGAERPMEAYTPEGFSM